MNSFIVKYFISVLIIGIVGMMFFVFPYAFLKIQNLDDLRRRPWWQRSIAFIFLAFVIEVAVSLAVLFTTGLMAWLYNTLITIWSS